MAQEMGKAVQRRPKEVEKCAWVCDYYAEQRRALPGRPSRSPTDATRSFVALRARSACVLAVMPWNFPFWQVFRFAAPALMAGNVGVLKHASNVPRLRARDRGGLPRAGLPGGRSSRTLLVAARQVVEAHRAPARRAVTLTGSDGGRAGRSAARPGGRSRRRCSSWAAATRSWSSRTPTSSSGRRRCADRAARSTPARAASPPSASSWSEPRADALREALRRAHEARRAMGDPLDRGHQRRPAGARRPARRAAPAGHAQRRRRARGSCSAARSRPGRGAFYPPTVLDRRARRACRPTTRRPSGRWRRSSRARDEEEAIRVANDSRLRPRRRRLDRATSTRGESDRARELEAGLRAS